MPEVQIRRAAMSDLAVVTDLHVALNREMASYSTVFPPEALRRRSMEYLVRIHLGRDDWMVWLAVTEDRVLGFISGGIIDSPLPGSDMTYGVISNLYVEPRHRREGAGSKLVNHIMQQFASVGARHVELHFLARNQKARDFWAAHGFTTESIKAVKSI